MEDKDVHKLIGDLWAYGPKTSSRGIADIIEKVPSILVADYIKKLHKDIDHNYEAVKTMEDIFADYRYLTKLVREREEY